MLNELSKIYSCNKAYLGHEIPAIAGNLSYRFWSRYITRNRSIFNKDQLPLLDWGKKW